MRLQPSDINVTNGVCLWPNLAGQTPSSNVENNSPYINNFACGMQSAQVNVDGAKFAGSTSCNFANEASVTDSASLVYYGMVANTTSKSAGATTAATYYQEFNVALSRYNCEEQYSHWNCDDCRKAYARWACAMTMPACTISPCAIVKPWQYVCYEVVQKCPVTLGFVCPDVANDDRDYDENGGNYMGLTAGAPKGSYVGAPLALAVTVFATLFMHH